MAEQALKNEPGKFKFKSIVLFKDQSLGIGSYGAVCKAQCDDLLCAAKIIHPTLFDPSVSYQISPKIEHRAPIRRFEQECEFLSSIRHPNIIQYLGMFRDKVEPYLPVLLMELMDDNLTHFLESALGPIPYHIQVNICHDVTRALSFLHSNKIIHRDLSSNNVLLIDDVRAKVTDFGMARLEQINPQATNYTNTMCPGTEVYMPPEAVQEKPVYSEKIDCFSFGVVTLQLLTRQFPNPGERYIIVDDPRYPRPLKMDVPESDRRQNHISKVSKDHPLLPLVLDCIKDRENDRHSAHQLCERVAKLKTTENYVKSAQELQPKEDTQQVKQLQQHLIDRDRDIEQLREERAQMSGQLDVAIDQLRRQKEDFDRLLADKARQLEEKTKQLEEMRNQLRDTEEESAHFERKVGELQMLSKVGRKAQTDTGRRSHTLSDVTPTISKVPSPRLKLKWRKGRRAPYETYRWCDAVVDGNMVYIRNAASVEVYSCNVSTELWYQLPHCVEMNSSMALVNGLLTTIGGKNMNKLYSLVGEDRKREWIEKFPPMPTKRRGTAALCTGTMLIVAGGVGEGGVVLSTVELMNTSNLQWSIAASLPQPMCYASMSVHDGLLYILGGNGKQLTPTKSVYTCSVATLLHVPQSNSLSRIEEDVAVTDKSNVWRPVADLPVTSSSSASFSDKLLAVGGKDIHGNPTKDVYMYNSKADTWETLCHMKTGRYDCFTAVVPENRLMIIGGSFARSEYTDSVEFIRVSD